jgi:hypothetical protein
MAAGYDRSAPYIYPAIPYPQEEPMRRLFATVAAAAALVVAPASAHAVEYSRPCGGIVDTECHGWVCPTDCWQRDCFLWIDVQHNSMTAVCVGQVAPSS